MKRLRQGFVLYDSIAALFLLSVMGFGAFSLYTKGMDQLRVSSERETVVRALNNQWEMISATPIAELSSLDGTGFVMPKVSDVLVDAESAVRISESDGIYTVALSVVWISYDGRRLEEQLVGLRSF